MNDAFGADAAPGAAEPPALGAAAPATSTSTSASASATALQAARQHFSRLQQALLEAGLAFRPPPPEPLSCCGRGCNGCVWEGFYAAAAYWCEDAEALLRQR